MKGNDEILENVMVSALLTKPERQMVRRSVLGPRFHRKAMEQKLFTGQTEAFEVGMNQLVRPDLEIMGLDEDHLKALVDEAIDNSKRETAPEELEVAQLRELVARAEGDIAEMRDRMMQCQANVKESMHRTSKRLLGIEDLIHTTLAELALIAGAAGVPDKKGGNEMIGSGGFVTTSNFGTTAAMNLTTSNTGWRLNKHLGTTGIGFDDPYAASAPENARPKAPGLSHTSGNLGDWHAAVDRVNQHAKGKRFRNH